jgi:hypothetical protein
MDAVIKKVSHADCTVSLAFVSVDGDEGPNRHFEEGFEKLLPFLRERSFGDKFRHFILSQTAFWVSDWLHLLKNARTRLFRTRISGNP